MADNKNETKSQTNSNRQRIGGAWLKSNDFGKFYSLSITKAEFNKLKVDERGNVQVLMYKAKELAHENSPNFNLFGFPPDASKTTPAKPATSTSKPTSKPKPPVDDAPVEPAEPAEEDLF